MPKSPGWTFRAVSAVATGTTSLTISKPTGTVDDDIMVMVLCHKGAAFATMPAGWTVVPGMQALSGATRGEMHWRRASGEGASYSVTGLADTACGVILSYDGGLLAGDVVNVAAIRANASGVTGVGSITPTVPHTLLIGAACLGGNFSVGSFGTQYAIGAAGVLVDPDLQTIVERADGGTANGTDCRVAVYDAIKIVPSETGGFTWSATAVENVGMIVAFVPETVAASAGTRYYLASKLPGAVISGAPHGDWDLSFLGPRAWEETQWTWQLSQIKSDAGRLTTHNVTTNRPAPADVFFARWMTPSLAAQAIGGTIDLTASVRAFYTATPLGAFVTAQYKIHVYVTVGQTAAVRATLLNQYVDAVNFPTAGTFRALAAPQALAAAVCEAGDSLLIEIGARISAMTNPVPTNPPTEFGTVGFCRGATNTSASTSAGVGSEDGVAGAVGTTGSAGFLDFSQTLVEQSLPTPPTNDACLDAVSIVALPTVDTRDTRASADTARAVWYRYTATFTGQLLVHAFGTSYFAEIRAFTGTCGTLTALPGGLSGIYRFDGLSAHRCTSMAYLAVTSGVTYTIRITAARSVFSAPSTGGALSVSFIQRVIVPVVDDLYLPCGHITIWRDGQLINLTPDFASSAPSGVAFDYTLRTMNDLNGGTHSGVRVLVGLHFFELVEIVDAATLNLGQFEIDFISTPFGSNQNICSLFVNTAGILHVGWFGDGYLDVADSAASFLNSLSGAAARAVRRISAINGDSQPGAPFTADSFAAAPDAAGSNYVQVSSGNVLFYCSGGEYLPIGGQLVKRFDLTGNVQLADFATVPATVGLNPGLKGLCLLSDGGLLVCNGTRVERLDSSGTVIQSYTPSPAVSSLADVKVLSSGTAFWCVDEATAALYKFDLTGAQLMYVPTSLTSGALTQLVLYQPTGVTPVEPPPPACPVSFVPDAPSDQTCLVGILP